MPVTFQQIASNTATLTINIANVGPVAIVYYPNKMTDKYVAALQAGNVDDNTLLIDLIKSWDIYEDADMTIMFPIERMDEFGYAFKVQVAMAVVNDLRPEAMTPQSLNGAH
jgi:ribonuclease PH